VSEYLREETRRQFQVQRPIEVIYNFVDVERFRPFKEKKKNFFGDGKILMHISNFRPVKRIEDVIGVFASVRRAIKARLVMVGDGPERAAAETLAGELGLGEDVHFLGNQVGVEQLLGQADLFLLPSEKESFGLGALEAMSCGVPVIGCQTGGLPEVVLHGETGFLAAVGDVEAMAQMALDILRDDELREHMGARARGRVLENFDGQAIIPQYEAFYQQVVAA
jgi:N-acetyl-alpha-D-glucosaminyl L-malate synthase BshA